MVLYTQPGCNHCKMIKALLDSKAVKYEECQDKAIMSTKGIDHTPAIEVDNKVFIANDMMKFIKELN